MDRQPIGVHYWVMHRFLPLILIVSATSAAWGQKADPPAATQPEAKQVCVAVAPFASDFDEGRWGGRVTDAFYLKLVRWPGTTAVSKFDYADFARAANFEAAWNTPVARAVKFARERLQVDILIWGDVLEGQGKGELSLRVRAVDLRAGEALAVDRVFEISYPTQVRPAVEIVLNQLVGYSVINMEVPALVKLTPEMEARWKSASNLVPNPGFEQGNDDVKTLARWECVLADKHYAPPWTDQTKAPLAADFLRHALWSPDPAGGRNRVLQMPISKDVAATYGVAVYSDWISITPGAIYRFSYRWRLAGPTPKVFIKGYALRPVPGELSADGGAAKFQRRETYRRQVHPTSEADPKRQLENGWTETTADFCPRHDQYPPHWIRIDIYAYWPAGHAWFDDVQLKQLSEGPVIEQHDPADIEDARLENDKP